MSDTHDHLLTSLQPRELSAGWRRLRLWALILGLFVSVVAATLAFGVAVQGWPREIHTAPDSPAGPASDGWTILAFGLSCLFFGADALAVAAAVLLLRLFYKREERSHPPLAAYIIVGFLGFLSFNVRMFLWVNIWGS